ncbi:PulJ/GspJ family protein [Ewingella americana]|uniref:PulJ/GspJ family protein n=1 Tax=Ewingella americana TaxID=41202 RepID=UPI0012AE70C5|nr:prepilin-type N-terminal cleavage/methylation domain-containing protein [Ewingella americana]MRT05935.1 prepilin-type N-terminal cleavage/methylation domain-containing protein [Ewingella americana]
MKMASHNLNDRSCGPGSRQTGFTLLEMLIALAVIALLAMAAQPMLKMGFQQLRHMKQASTGQGESLPEALQWLENDVLQMRGDLPWRWEGALDKNSCLVRWQFVTENAPRTQGPGVVRSSVQYRVEGGVLIREMLHDGRLETAFPLLEGVKCLHPSFWQRTTWRSVPLRGMTIQALKFTLDWEGPQVVRIWPVNITYGS